MGRRQPAYFFSGMRSPAARNAPPGECGRNRDASALVALAPGKAGLERQKTLFF